MLYFMVASVAITTCACGVKSYLRYFIVGWRYGNDDLRLWRAIVAISAIKAKSIPHWLHALMDALDVIHATVFHVTKAG